MTGKKYDDDWHEWCVFVDEKKDIIDKIEFVEYFLHPTFPNRHRIIDDKLSKFALYSSGWGAFTIKINVKLKIGDIIETTHFLNLYRDHWPKKSASGIFENKDKEAIYNALISEKHRWRKLDTIIKQTNLSKTKVLEILKELENDELARKSQFLSIDKKEMWSATSIVGCSPRYQ
jgi:transcription initiation factor IIF auxiliary subunit